MATGPCPEGLFVKKSEWEDTILPTADWLENDGFTKSELRDYPPPKAIDTWLVRVDEPAKLAFVDQSLLPPMDGAWIGVTCIEVSPGSFGLLGEEVVVVGTDEP
jgi:hypothetical protein